MNNIIVFDICAICIVVFEMVALFIKNRLKSIQNKIFSIMLLLNLGSAITDLMCGIIRNGLVESNRLWASGFVYAYYMFHSALPVLFAIYMLASTEMLYKIYKTYRLVLFVLPAMFAYFLLALNEYTHVYFVVGPKGEYSRAAGAIYIYIQALFYFTFVMIYVQRYRGLYNLYKRLSVYMFSFAVFVPTGIQFFHPNILVEVFGETLGFQILYMCIENPEESMDHELGIMNRKAFIDKVRMNFKTDNNFHILSVSIDEWAFLQKTFGVDILSSVWKSLIENVNELFGEHNKEMYHISENQIYVLSFSERVGYDDVAEKLISMCEKGLKVGQIEIALTLDICIIDCPEDFRAVEDIFQYTEEVSNERHSGGSRIVHAKDDRGGYGKRKADVRMAIHKALKNGTFQVYYQPIFSTVENKVLSAEALVRLRDDELGFISPEEFIPIAEKDGTILEIGDFVLESVCRFIKENKIREKGIDFIEINISVVECMKQNMVNRVAEKLNKYDILPGQVNLEITETAASNSSDIMNNNMQHLVDRGIAFSLDDYGSGYSNINYLISLPFHLIKMDKNIVWSAFDNEKAGTVLESSVSMIRKLNLKIVAEGVETEEQKDALTRMGCEYLQGYYFSKPLPEKEFLEYLASAG